MRSKKTEQEDTGIDGAQAAPKRVTPVDIQEKVFRQAKGPFRGYDERDVDAFLDEVTEEFAKLHAENKRLREQVGMQGTETIGVGQAPYAPAAAYPGPMEGDAELRDLTSSFISRERSFLQSLAGIIQQHAESVKGDVRRARGVMAQPPPAAPAPAVVDLTAAEEREPVAAPVPRTVPAGAATSAAPGEPEEDPTIREMFWGEE
jgi:DivIVA domain-containing protein